MFRKTETPLLGVVENMAWFEEPSTGTRIPIFGEGGARAEAVRLGVPLLAEIPLETPLRAACDEGRPLVLSSPESASSRAFTRLAAAVA